MGFVAWVRGYWGMVVCIGAVRFREQGMVILLGYMEWALFWVSYAMMTHMLAENAGRVLASLQCCNNCTRCCLPSLEPLVISK